MFGHAEFQDYLLNFINNLDPNVGTGNRSAESPENLINWPRYTPSSKQLLTMLDGAVPLTISKDDFRRAAIDYLILVSLRYPI